MHVLSSLVIDQWIFATYKKPKNIQLYHKGKKYLISNYVYDIIYIQ